MGEGTRSGGLLAILFTAGEFRFAMEATHVAGMRAPGRGPEAGDPPMVEALLGLPLPTPGTARRWLVMRGGWGGGLLSVPDGVALTEWPATAIHPLPPLLAARLTIPGAAALAFDAMGAVLFIAPPAVSADETRAVVHDRVRGA
jgi:hypothetical protein